MVLGDLMKPAGGIAHDVDFGVKFPFADHHDERDTQCGEVLEVVVEPVGLDKVPDPDVEATQEVGQRVSVGGAGGVRVGDDGDIRRGGCPYLALEVNEAFQADDGAVRGCPGAEEGGGEGVVGAAVAEQPSLLRLDLERRAVVELAGVELGEIDVGGCAAIPDRPGQETGAAQPLPQGAWALWEDTVDVLAVPVG